MTPDKFAEDFTVEDNSIKDFAEFAISKGYDAKHAGLNSVGLHIVSYFNSEDKSEILINLAMIRKNDNPSAWILKK